jgi:hypothetical protein
MDDLDDEDMAKLDTALANVFKQLSGGKKSPSERRKDKKDALAQIHFKLRALDMIDSYLSHQPNMSNMIILADPLLKCLETSSKDKNQAPLETRLKGSLRKLTNVKKAELDSDMSGDLLVNLLESLVDLANSGSPIVQGLCQPMPLFAQLSNLIIKFGQQMKDGTEKRIKEVFVSALDDFFHKR